MSSIGIPVHPCGEVGQQEEGRQRWIRCRRRGRFVVGRDGVVVYHRSLPRGWTTMENQRFCLGMLIWKQKTRLMSGSVPRSHVNLEDHSLMMEDRLLLMYPAHDGIRSTQIANAGPTQVHKRIFPHYSNLWACEGEKCSMERTRNGA